MLNITAYTFKRFKYLIFITHFELKWNYTSEINCAWNSDKTSTFFAYIRLAVFIALVMVQRKCEQWGDNSRSIHMYNISMVNCNKFMKRMVPIRAYHL